MRFIVCLLLFGCALSAARELRKTKHDLDMLEFSKFSEQWTESFRKHGYGHGERYSESEKLDMYRDVMFGKVIDSAIRNITDEIYTLQNRGEFGTGIWSIPDHALDKLIHLIDESHTPEFPYRLYRIPNEAMPLLEELYTSHECFVPRVFGYSKNSLGGRHRGLIHEPYWYPIVYQDQLLRNQLDTMSDRLSCELGGTSYVFVEWDQSIYPSVTMNSGNTCPRECNPEDYDPYADDEDSDHCLRLYHHRRRLFRETAVDQNSWFRTAKPAPPKIEDLDALWPHPNVPYYELLSLHQ